MAQIRRYMARWASFSRLPAPQPRIAGDAVPYMQEMVGGFALHEALWLRVASVSEPHVVQFPRLVSESEGCGGQSADRLGEKR